MALKITKGGKIGKYFYIENAVEYGPVELNELLENISKHTLVYYEGITWTKASEITELKKYFTTEERIVEKVVDRVVEKNIIQQPEKKGGKIILIAILVASMLLLICSLYWIYQQQIKSDIINADLQRKKETDSLAAINANLIEQEQRRVQDSILAASNAILDSVKLLKLNMDYQLGVDKVNVILNQFYTDLSNHDYNNVSNYFKDTLIEYSGNYNVSTNDIINSLNNSFNSNRGFEENYKLQDSSCVFVGMDGETGAYNYYFEYSRNGRNGQKSEQSVTLNGTIKVDSDFKIVFYQWNSQVLN